MTIGYCDARGRVDAFLCRHAVVRARELHDLGLRNADIDTFVRRGRLRRIGRGIYRSSQFSESPDQVVAAAALRVPKGVVCLTSAAFIHGLVVDRPSHVWLAVPAKAWPPKATEPPIRTWWASARAFGLPTEVREIAGVPVRVFTEAATVSHLVARRDLVGEDTAAAAVRVLLGVAPGIESLLVEYARSCRAGVAMDRLLSRVE
jgi:predicted transcriptional regulator of viral defense system